MSLKPKKLHSKSLKQKRFVKLAKSESTVKTHIERALSGLQLFQSVKVMGPVNGEYWVDVTSPKRSAWGWNKVSDVKKEMKQVIPKAKYDKYFEGSKDNPVRIVYFKVPENVELKGVTYKQYEMEEV